jgi:hypothetical protein
MDSFLQRYSITKIDSVHSKESIFSFRESPFFYLILLTLCKQVNLYLLFRKIVAVTLISKAERLGELTPCYAKSTPGYAA